MEYLISEDELWGLIGEAEYRDRKVKAIEIKSKQPVKTLNRVAVEEILRSFAKTDYSEKKALYLIMDDGDEDVDALITAICNLELNEVSK